MNKIITLGVFDYFNLGKLRLFKQYRKYVNYVIVADEKKLYFNDERMEVLNSIKEIDEVEKWNAENNIKNGI